jgi:hypothetical protein
LELPDERLAAAVDANRRFLLLLHDGDEITPGPSTYHRFWFRDAAYLLAALDCYGYHDEVAQVLRSYPGRQHADGFFFSQRKEWDANGAALHALVQHWRLTRDAALVESMVGPIAKGVHWIDRKRHARKANRNDAALRGLLPAGVSAEHLGPFDYFYWDDFWGVAGLRAGAELLRAVGQDEAATEAERFAASMWGDLERSLELTAERLGTIAIPAGPRRRIDSGAIGSLVACAPLDLLAPDDPRIAATVAVIRRRFMLDTVPATQEDAPDGGRAFFQGISHTGLGRAAGGGPALPGSPGLDAGRRHPDLDVARGHPPPPRRRLHGGRPPRMGRRRAPDLRARPARARRRGRGGAGIAGARRLVRPGLGGPRRAHSRRPRLLRGPLAR